MRVEFTMDAALSPERVLAVLTDFSGRRPDVWPGLDRASYEVHEVGEASALVTEGTRSPVGTFWARERYEWSPGKVRWRTEESNFCAPGSGVDVDIHPRNGGSRVEIRWERKPVGIKGQMLMALMRIGGRRALNAWYEKPLKGLAAEG